jgi:hypothetical protein
MTIWVLRIASYRLNFLLLYQSLDRFTNCTNVCSLTLLALEITSHTIIYTLAYLKKVKLYYLYEVSDSCLQGQTKLSLQVWLLYYFGSSFGFYLGSTVTQFFLSCFKTLLMELVVSDL